MSTTDKVCDLVNKLGQIEARYAEACVTEFKAINRKRELMKELYDIHCEIIGTVTILENTLSTPTTDQE